MTDEIKTARKRREAAAKREARVLRDRDPWWTNDDLREELLIAFCIIAFVVIVAISQP